jgi:hypothetical protein
MVDEILYYQAGIYKLEPPDYSDLRDIQQFMIGNEMELPLLGPDRHIWGSYNDPTAHADDGLVAFRPRQRTDAFSNIVGEYIFHLIGPLRFLRLSVERLGKAQPRMPSILRRQSPNTRFG